MFLNQVPYLGSLFRFLIGFLINFLTWWSSRMFYFPMVALEMLRLCGKLSSVLCLPLLGITRSPARSYLGSKTSYIFRVSSMHLIKGSLIQVPYTTRTDDGAKFEYHEISVHHYQYSESILSSCSGCCIYRGNTFSFLCCVDILGSQRHLLDLLYRIKQKGYLPLWQVLNKHLSHFLLSTVFSKPQITKVGKNW